MSSLEIKPAPKKLKLLYLIDILNRETDEEHMLGTGEIIERLYEYGIEVARKCVYEDIAILQEYGYDIMYSKGKKNGYFMGSREFELPEVRLLMDAVQSASFITQSKSKELLQKLEKLCSRYNARQIRNQVYIPSSLKQHINEKIYYHIDNISNAIDRHKKVELVYMRRQLTGKEQCKFVEKPFVVSPYAMSWWNGFYYLICNNEKYDNLMHLRLDRIKRSEISADMSRPFSEVSEYDLVFDTADYMSKVFSMFGGEHIEAIELRCHVSLIDSVCDRFGQEVPMRSSINDYFVIRAEAALSEGLLSWILQFGDKIEVLGPVSLRADIRAKAKALRRLYKV